MATATQGDQVVEGVVCDSASVSDVVGVNGCGASAPSATMSISREHLVADIAQTRVNHACTDPLAGLSNRLHFVQSGLSMAGHRIQVKGDAGVNTRWMGMAVCAGVGPEPFFAEPGGSGAVAHAAAKRLCRVCPVASECLEHALRVEEESVGPRYGVWGGLTASERASLARGRGGLT